MPSVCIKNIIAILGDQISALIQDKGSIPCIFDRGHSGFVGIFTRKKTISGKCKIKRIFRRLECPLCKIRIIFPDLCAKTQTADMSDIGRIRLILDVISKDVIKCLCGGTFFFEAYGGI